MKFDYKTFMPPTSNAKWGRMPFVEIEIFGPKDMRKGLALVDSGAEYCIINIEFAEKLGIDLQNSKIINFHGVAGQEHVKPAYLHKVSIKVSGMDKIEVEAGFIDSSSVGIILGQQDFFDVNKIKFERDHNTFEVIPVKQK